jgi:D-threo-aldose 1-dehydrogenase
MIMLIVVHSSRLIGTVAARERFNRVLGRRTRCRASDGVTGMTDAGCSTLLPAVGFGTAPLGGLFEPVSADEAVAAVVAGLEAGYRYFDTAPLYGYGAAERALGRALAGCEAEVAVSTKVGRIVDENAPATPGDVYRCEAGAASFDFSADGVRRSLEASLGRLGRDYIDAVFIHDPDDHARAALEEAYPALERLRAEGVVGAVGVGMNQPSLPTRFVNETDIDLVLVAGRYTLLDRSAERALFPAAQARGVHVVAAGVYNSGILAGAAAGPGKPRSLTFDYETAPAEVVVRADGLRTVCERFGVPLEAASVQFAARHPAVGTVLVGARSAAEAQQNWLHLHRRLPEDLWRSLAVLDGRGANRESHARESHAYDRHAPNGRRDASDTSRVD